jgi:hypothetical protein
MTDTLDKPQDKPQLNGKTVQEYIDERPTWPDGTMLPTTPMTAMQFRIWALACAGKFFEGMVVFMTGWPSLPTDRGGGRGVIAWPLAVRCAQLVFQGTNALLGAGEQLTREAAVFEHLRID